MPSGRRRVLQVETSLTPRQAAVLWLQEAHAFGSMLDYASWLNGQPATAYPLQRLPRQVEQAVRQAMKGQPRPDVERAVRSAIKDVVFLFQVQQQANLRVVMEQRAQAFCGAYLAVRLPDHPLKGGSGEDSWREEAGRWKTEAELAFVEFHALRHALALLGERYFDGNDVLFPDAREQFETIVGSLDQLVDLYDDEVLWQGHLDRQRRKKRKGATPKAIDREALLQAAQERGAWEAERLVGDAKAHTLRAMGEHGAADALLDRLIWGEG